MKNFTLVIALVAIAFLAAVSCSPEVEIRSYDWSEVNAPKNPLQNLGADGANVPGPYFTITDSTTTPGGVITEIKVNITFDEEADVLRESITEANAASILSFITFHTFSYATTPYIADTLSSAIPFAFDKRAGNVISVKLTSSIATIGGNYSSLIMKIDATKYTYDHGLRLDIDNNGKIEAIYDDVYFDERSLGGNIDNYTPNGQMGSLGIQLGSFPSITSYTASQTPPANPTIGDGFFFTVSGTSTNQNTVLFLDTNYNTDTSAQATADNAFAKDVAEALAKGIKLQKWNGSSWADVATAEYVGQASDSTQGYIIFKNITFDHLATYRTIWTGSAYTETTNNYYGVKQRVYVYGNTNRTNAARYTVTEVAGSLLTAINTTLLPFYSGTPTTERYSYDHENRNTVYRIELTGDAFWNTVTQDKFIESFEVYYLTTNTAVNNSTTNRVKVGVSNISFKSELLPDATKTGDNVLYLTLDPNFSSTGKYLTFRVNNGISVTNKSGATDVVQYFGNSANGNGLYDLFSFYGPVSP